MIAFPNAKINLGLYITEKRLDGFHNIETIFYPIYTLCDILEIIPAEHNYEPIAFSQSGLLVGGNPQDNLCVKAYHLLAKHTTLPKVAMHLHKQIPMGAGLGGGSADGAFALKMCNDLAENPLSLPELESLALELGSDCPFFLKNIPCLGKGRGEILEPIDIKLNGYLMLVNSGVHVNTGRAYAKCTPRSAPFDLNNLESHYPVTWKELIANDFENIVFPQYPVIADIKDKLYQLGAVYAGMSGSGSTVFGLFIDEPSIPQEFTGYYNSIHEM
ncbi:MAG: 4-(cytidine 5'-diphospho)-2-C-methyl-D-erythritol kinase [Tenuifilaceae bacterium]|jgi:4-diphosphocytidyl-2-C-methyl-D-erythritol kinase|nr:4-(cytidine 5'-diphospho)-2-C-methyl-D-erythritol kinase [Tenuifilaceae bacterium]